MAIPTNDRQHALKNHIGFPFAGMTLVAESVSRGAIIRFGRTSSLKLALARANAGETSKIANARRVSARASIVGLTARQR
jgi:hypothetical protein